MSDTAWGVTDSQYTGNHQQLQLPAFSAVAQSFLQVSWAMQARSWLPCTQIGWDWLLCCTAGETRALADCTLAAFYQNKCGVLHSFLLDLSLRASEHNWSINQRSELNCWEEKLVAILCSIKSTQIQSFANTCCSFPWPCKLRGQKPLCRAVASESTDNLLRAQLIFGLYIQMHLYRCSYVCLSCF